MTPLYSSSSVLCEREIDLQKNLLPSLVDPEAKSSKESLPCCNKKKSLQKLKLTESECKENDQTLVKLRKKIQYFLIDFETPKEISALLFDDLPENLNFEEVVDIIFEDHGFTHTILQILEGFLFKYDQYTLSPFNKIRKAILEDKNHLLRNNSLNAMLKEAGLENEHDKIKRCYDLAYFSNHPFIYPLAKETVKAHEYTLNFLWINLNPQDRIKDLAENIFGDGLNHFENTEYLKYPEKLRRFEQDKKSLEKEDLAIWDNIKKTFSYQMLKWVKKNPGTPVNLWFDSALVTQKAVENTFAMINAFNKEQKASIQLRDIRQLSNIKGEIKNALHPATPVFFRVDLLKVLITDYFLSNPKEKTKFCVISDVDIEPMSSKKLFDERTLNYLSSFGYVFNKNGVTNFENSFSIFNQKKENLKIHHKKAMIDSVLSTILAARKGLTHTIMDSQFVFKFYYTTFQPKMEKLCKPLDEPRKFVKCPRSQFCDSFPKKAHQKERFHFKKNNKMPHTRFGRNYLAFGSEEAQIPELISWKAKPLAIPK